MIQNAKKLSFDLFLEVGLSDRLIKIELNVFQHLATLPAQKNAFFNDPMSQKRGFLPSSIVLSRQVYFQLAMHTCDSLLILRFSSFQNGLWKKMYESESFAGEMVDVLP